ncbi:MAG: Rrf2 family transcriptional regulator [Rhodospirillaceae bacterium]|nr:Rrf2 family transcriptional regulator [Rhodospirillaceae bacterium]MBT5515773.1 Rrf2 family transcriptional regulator [Rhodospirillaceae bacterium]
MFRLSKKALFAIEAVLDIAYHAGAEPVQSREITRRQGIPRRYLEQALQQLVRSGILVGVRGPRGGYRLARERRRINVGDIVRVVHASDGPDGEDPEIAGSELGLKVVQPLWLEMQETIMQRLDETSIDDLCGEADNAGILSEGRQTLDFTI